MNTNITFNKSIIFLFSNVPHVLDLMLFVYLFTINKIQVHRGNILKTTGMLCNPKFVSKNNRYFNLSSIYFLYPLTSLPKMVKQEMPTFIEQS